MYLNRPVNNSGYSKLAVGTVATMVPMFVNEIKIVTTKKIRVGRINYRATFGFSGSI